ncbi:Crp/Fnr family transcriptional regulator [Ideonella paludis]|uniref:Crp/Fnr family transcriptional regulator n=1 Tax=Ideonella paludis TaxID=1233411 RepID=A0ABS5DWH6_9BURK|nr:Crp/Fnr family transcriptional regulator [Ideonella paludis]MBQ0935497.1 Crp/Fnr family transcriptional regulator [Ideonella paludis]
MTNPPSLDDLQACLSQGAWFAQLPRGLQQALLAHGQVQALEPGQRLFLQGDACDGLYAVLSGAVLIRSSRADGRQMVLAVLQAPTWFGEISIIDDGPRTHDAHAQGPTRLWWVSRSLLDDLLERHPVLWRHLARLVTGKTRLLFMRLNDRAAQSAQARLLQELLRLAEGYGMADSTALPRCLPITLEHWAGLAGTSRQTASEVLGQLQRLGVVRRHSQGLEVLSLEALRAQLAKPSS